MSLGGLSEMLGMGVVIQLRNMFTVPAMAVEKSSRSLTNAIVGDQRTITTGFRLLGAGALTSMVGAGLMGGMLLVAKYALDTSSKLEILRKQMIILTHSDAVGTNLLESLKQMSLQTPFTIDKIAEAAKLLLGFGIPSNKIVSQLSKIGEAASIMQKPIEEAAVAFGKINSGGAGISLAMRYLQRLGVSYAAIQAAGGPVSKGRALTNADPEKFMDAVNKVLTAKFGGGMKTYMSTIPGMMTNLRDQLIYFWADVGDEFKPAIKGILSQIMHVFNPELIKPFAVAVGQGIGLILRTLTAVLTPLAKFGVWIMQLSKEYPGLVKYGIAMVFFGTAAITAAGALMMIVGAWKILSFLWASAKVAEMAASLWAMAGPIGWLIAAAVLFGVAWTGNFANIRTVLTYFWDSASLVFGGVLDLITSLHDGVGHMSKSTYDLLSKAGLLGLAIGLFQLFYRLKAFVSGVWTVMVAGVKVLAWIGAAAMWLLSPVFAVVYALYKVAEGLGWVGDLMSSNTWYNFGVAVGGVFAAIFAVKAVTWLCNTAMLVWQGTLFLTNVFVKALDASIWLWNAAVRGATAVQWAWNAAMAANPIGLVIIAVAAVIIILVVFLYHLRQISDWWSKAPIWVRGLVGALLPFVAMAIDIYRNWDRTKVYFTQFKDWLIHVWDVVTDYLWNKVTLLLGKLKSAVLGVRDWFGGSTTFASEYDANRAMSRDQLNGLARTPPMYQVNGPYATATAGDRGYQFQAEQHHRELLDALRTRPIVLHTTLQLDGKVVAKNTTQHQQDERDGGW